MHLQPNHGPKLEQMNQMGGSVLVAVRSTLGILLFSSWFHCFLPPLNLVRTGLNSEPRLEDVRKISVTRIQM